MADRALLRRNPSHPLLSLQLKHYNDDGQLPDSYIPSLLSKARSLGLHHLTIEGLDLVPILPSIFSISSLKSLSLDCIIQDDTFPSGLTLTCLRSLSLTLLDFHSTAKLNQLLSELCSLEDLQLEIHVMDGLSLSSQTIRNLKLIIDAAYSKFNTLKLFLPSLESIHLENLELLPSLFHIHGEVPMLKRAVIILNVKTSVLSMFYLEDVSAVKRLLKCISHVEELSLHVKDKKNAFPILLEPVKGMPNFPNLKHLHLRLCFHDHNIRAVIMMLLYSCPALESLNLEFHEITKFTRFARGRKRKEWKAKLLLNANGNYRYAYFRNLHLVGNRKEFRKFLKYPSRRHALN